MTSRKGKEITAEVATVTTEEDNERKERKEDKGQTFISNKKSKIMETVKLAGNDETNVVVVCGKKRTSSAGDEDGKNDQHKDDDVLSWLNSDLLLHLLSYLNVQDSTLLGNCGRRLFYLVSNYRTHIHGPELISLASSSSSSALAAATSSASASASASSYSFTKHLSPHELIHDCLRPKLQRPPQLLLAFSKPNPMSRYDPFFASHNSNSRYGKKKQKDDDHLTNKDNLTMLNVLQQTSWPKDCVILGAIASDIQVNQPNNANESSNTSNTSSSSNSNNIPTVEHDSNDSIMACSFSTTSTSTSTSTSETTGTATSSDASASKSATTKSKNSSSSSSSSSVIIPFSIPDRENGSSYARRLQRQLTKIQQEAEDGTKSKNFWKAMIVYACGDDGGSAVEDFVLSMQRSFPDMSIVGGMCSRGYVTDPKSFVASSSNSNMTGNTTRATGDAAAAASSTTACPSDDDNNINNKKEDLTKMTIRQLRKLQTEILLQLQTNNNSSNDCDDMKLIKSCVEKSDLIDAVWQLQQKQQQQQQQEEKNNNNTDDDDDGTALEYIDDGVFGIVLGGYDVPVRSMVSRGVRSLTESMATATATANTRSSSSSSSSQLRRSSSSSMTSKKKDSNNDDDDNNNNNQTESSASSSSRYVVHECTLAYPGDDDYPFAFGDHYDMMKPLHRITSLIDRQMTNSSNPNGTVVSASSVINQIPYADFIGLKRRQGTSSTNDDGTTTTIMDGFELHMMMNPYCQVTGSFLIMQDNISNNSNINSIEEDDGNNQRDDDNDDDDDDDDTGNDNEKSKVSMFENAEVDLFALDGQACIDDMDAAVQRLYEQTRQDKQILGAVMFSCNGRGPTRRGLISKEMADASIFARYFPSTPCLGFYAGGEIGPLALAGRTNSIFQTGRVAVQGFTAVFLLFIVPQQQRRRPLKASSLSYHHASINDSPDNVKEYIQRRFLLS